MSKPSTARRCAIFYCDKARERRCCADCQDRCRNACKNHPSRCGQEDKAPMRKRP